MKITLHDGSENNTTEDSLARLAKRQQEHIEKMRAQRDRLMILLTTAEKALRQIERVHDDCRIKLITNIQEELKNGPQL